MEKKLIIYRIEQIEKELRYIADKCDQFEKELYEREIKNRYKFTFFRFLRENWYKIIMILTPISLFLGWLMDYLYKLSPPHK